MDWADFEQADEKEVPFVVRADVQQAQFLLSCFIERDPDQTYFYSPTRSSVFLVPLEFVLFKNEFYDFINHSSWSVGRASYSVSDKMLLCVLSGPVFSRFLLSGDDGLKFILRRGLHQTKISCKKIKLSVTYFDF